VPVWRLLRWQGFRKGGLNVPISGPSPWAGGRAGMGGGQEGVAHLAEDDNALSSPNLSPADFDGDLSASRRLSGRRGDVLGSTRNATPLSRNLGGKLSDGEALLRYHYRCTPAHHHPMVVAPAYSL